MYIIFTNLLLLHAYISIRKITEDMKRHGVVGSLAHDHFDIDVERYLKLVRSFIFNVRRKLKAARFHMTNVSCIKRQFQMYDIIKTPEFVIQIDENPSKSMRVPARKM